MSGKASDWGRRKKHLAVTNGETSCSDGGSSGLDAGWALRQRRLARWQRCRRRAPRPGQGRLSPGSNHPETPRLWTSPSPGTEGCPHCATRGSVLHSLQPNIKQTHRPGEQQYELTRSEPCPGPGPAPAVPSLRRGTDREWKGFPAAITRPKQGNPTDSERFLLRQNNKPHFIQKPARPTSPDCDQMCIFKDLVKEDGTELWEPFGKCYINSIPFHSPWSDL